MDYRKFLNRFDIILSLPVTVVFNFYYLPVKQAIKLPILLYRPTLWGWSGKVKIKSEKIHFGMIHLGRRDSALFNKKGVCLNNKGTIVFRGNASFGAGTVMQVGENAILDIGEKIANAIGLQIDCRYKIRILDNTSFGWNVILMDSAMHRTKYRDGGYTGRGYGEIIIGKNNWITTNCIVQAGAKTPDYCICATGALLNKDYSSEESYCLMAGCPAKVKKVGIWRDMSDCGVIYDIPKEDED